MSYQLDHRQLADEMNLYFFDEQIGAGLPIWLPNGVIIRDELEKFVKELERRAGYQRVVSPHIAKAELYEQSGHLSAFKQDMFPPLHWPEENQDYYLKPMNCPHHHKVFASSLRSFRQLPLKIAEYGQVYRYEPSGSLRGLSRVRGLCQNDAHIYIEPEKAYQEISEVLELHELCYRLLGLKNYRYRLSLHDPERKQDFHGDPLLWSKCENILRQVLIDKKLNFFEAKGEAAFYGPKIDIQMMMSSQNEESVSSIQLDFVSSDKFNLSYIASSGEAKRPWIIHRAPLGSHERFVALLLEFYEGQLPAWLAPVQVSILAVSESDFAQAQILNQELNALGIRAKVNESGGSLSKRILFAHKERPFCKIILGEKELRSGQFQLQLRNGVLQLSRQQLKEELRKLCASPIDG